MGSIYGDDVTEARALSRLIFVHKGAKGARLILEQDDLGSAPTLKVQGPRGGIRFHSRLDAKEIDELICILGAVRARMLAAQDPQVLATYRRLASREVEEPRLGPKGKPRLKGAGAEPDAGGKSGKSEIVAGGGFRLGAEAPSPADGGTAGHRRRR